jgi:hypothetical protein
LVKCSQISVLPSRKRASRSAVQAVRSSRASSIGDGLRARVAALALRHQQPDVEIAVRAELAAAVPADGDERQLEPRVRRRSGAEERAHHLVGRVGPLARGQVARRAGQVGLLDARVRGGQIGAASVRLLVARSTGERRQRGGHIHAC